MFNINSDLKIHNHEIRVAILFDLEIYHIPYKQADFKTQNVLLLTYQSILLNAKYVYLHVRQNQF
jgi:hypothetical protein